MAAPLQVPRRYTEPHLAFLAAVLREPQHVRPYALALTRLRIVVQRRGNPAPLAEEALCLFLGADAAGSSGSNGSSGNGDYGCINSAGDARPCRPTRRVLDLGAGQPKPKPLLGSGHRDQLPDLPLAAGVPTPALLPDQPGAPSMSVVLPMRAHQPRMLLDCVWGARVSRLPTGGPREALPAIRRILYGPEPSADAVSSVAPSATLPGPSWVEPMQQLNLLDLDPQPSPSTRESASMCAALQLAVQVHQGFSSGEMAWPKRDRSGEELDELLGSTRAPREARAEAAIRLTEAVVRRVVGAPRAEAVAATYSGWVASGASPEQRLACERVLARSLLPPAAPAATAAAVATPALPGGGGGSGSGGGAGANHLAGFNGVLGQLRPSLLGALPGSWGSLAKQAALMAAGPPPSLQSMLGALMDLAGAAGGGLDTDKLVELLAGGMDKKGQYEQLNEVRSGSCVPCVLEEDVGVRG